MPAPVKPEMRTSDETEFASGDRLSSRDEQPIQTEEERRELALMRRIEAGDCDTGQQLITSSMLHVLRSNRHYARNGTRIFELLDAGRQGLAHALKNFEPQGTESFSSYASTCIRQHIEQVLNGHPPATSP